MWKRLRWVALLAALVALLVYLVALGYLDPSRF